MTITAHSHLSIEPQNSSTDLSNSGSSFPVGHLTLMPLMKAMAGGMGGKTAQSCILELMSLGKLRRCSKYLISSPWKPFLYQTSQNGTRHPGIGPLHKSSSA